MSSYSSNTDLALSALRSALASATVLADEAYRHHTDAINDLTRAARDLSIARQNHSSITDRIDCAGAFATHSDFDHLREAELQLRAAEMRLRDFEERVRTKEYECQRAQGIEEQAREELERYRNFIQRGQDGSYRSQRRHPGYDAEYRTPSPRGQQGSGSAPRFNKRQQESYGTQSSEPSASAGRQRRSPPPGWRSQRPDTPPSSYPAFDPRTPSHSQSKQQRNPGSEPFGRGRTQKSASRSNVPRRISEQAIASWLKAVEAMGTCDYADLRVFPEPPSASCGKAGCRNEQLQACKCNLREIMRGIADQRKLRTIRILFHPDKFARCAEDVRADFQRKAQEIFVTLG